MPGFLARLKLDDGAFPMKFIKNKKFMLDL